MAKILDLWYKAQNDIQSQDALMDAYREIGAIDGCLGSLSLTEAQNRFDEIMKSPITDAQKDMALDVLGCAIVNNIEGGNASNLYMTILETKLDLV